jgi:predicted ATPase
LYLRYLEIRREEVPDFGRYPFRIPAVRDLQRLEFHPEVTFLVGENGSGKSTLLEAIAIKVGVNAEGGTKNSMLRRRPTESVLHEYLTLAREPRRETNGFFLRAEAAFNSGFFALHQYQSHGEGFISVVRDGLQGRGIYLMDEPESALSPTRQLALLSAIQELVGRKSQFVISTHSPIVAAYPDAFIYELNEHGLNRVAYEESEIYRSSARFYQDPGHCLRQLGL